MKLRPLVYVMAPFRAPTAIEREANIHWAKMAGVQIAAIGACPVVPHANVAYYYDSFDESEMMNICFSLLSVCAAVMVVSTERLTTGMQQEIEFCKTQGIPVFYSLSQLREHLYIQSVLKEKL